MWTREFESDFYRLLSTEVEPKHRNLMFTVPPSGGYDLHGRTVPSPDLIIEDPATGRGVVVEIKGYKYGESLPMATLSQMKAVKAAFKNAASDIMLITAADVPSVIGDALRHEGIIVERVTSARDAVERLETRLQHLEQPTPTLAR